VMHNTLAASDYGLLDEKTLTPRPNYWGALLWRKLMGNIVLNPGVLIETDLHVYAHCQRRRPGRVTLLVINPSRTPQSLTLPDTSERYTLDAANLGDTNVRLNGHKLGLSPQDDLPRITGALAAAGAVTFAPATITFLATSAPNNAC
jgi:heparanase 1